MERNQTSIRDPKRPDAIVKYKYRPERALSSMIVEQYQIATMFLAGIALVGRVSIDICKEFLSFTMDDESF
jgi:hypothetical protein